MSLDRCLPDLERKGLLDVGRSKEARELYEELRRYYERSHDPATAAALASQKTVERLEAAAAHKKRNTIRMIQAQQGILDKARRYNGGDPAGTGPIDPKGGEAMLAFDGRAGHNDSVAARIKASRAARTRCSTSCSPTITRTWSARSGGPRISSTSCASCSSLARPKTTTLEGLPTPGAKRLKCSARGSTKPAG
jgi:hypothetical protein